MDSERGNRIFAWGGGGGAQCAPPPPWFLELKKKSLVGIGLNNEENKNNKDRSKVRRQSFNPEISKCQFQPHNGDYSIASER